MTIFDQTYDKRLAANLFQQINLVQNSASHSSSLRPPPLSPATPIDNLLDATHWERQIKLLRLTF